MHNGSESIKKHSGKKHENKNPFIKIAEDNTEPRTFADVASTRLQRPPQSRRNNQVTRQVSRPTSSAENERNQRSQIQRTQQNRPGFAHQNRGHLMSVAANNPPIPPPALETNNRINDLPTNTDTRRAGDSDQLYSRRGRGRGCSRGRGRGREWSRGRGQSRGRPPRY